jgi:hypothetical protein
MRLQWKIIPNLPVFIIFGLDSFPKARFSESWLISHKELEDL